MTKKLLLGMAICAALSSCSQKSNIITIPVSDGSQYGGPVTLPEPAPGRLIGSAPQNVLPKATVFKMTGDYADRVAVTLGPDGRLSYFPDPSDISEFSRPESLGEGWYLNRQGIGPNSVFTKWTFEEYSKLDKVPSVSEIKEAIIPGARVKEFITLPVSFNEAQDMKPSEILKLIK